MTYSGNSSHANDTQNETKPAKEWRDGTKRVETIEILGATLEEASLKKVEFFSADLRPILCSEEMFCRPLKNCSFEVNYLV
jgi:hypothetical protein